MTTPWAFDVFSAWLSNRAAALQDAGMSVEFQRQDGPRASVRLRAESLARIGELTVWSDGTAHEAVLDLSSGNFVYERDGTQLEGDDSGQLAIFFAETVAT